MKAYDLRYALHSPSDLFRTLHDTRPIQTWVNSFLLFNSTELLAPRVFYKVRLQFCPKKLNSSFSKQPLATCTHRSEYLVSRFAFRRPASVFLLLSKLLPRISLISLIVPLQQVFESKLSSFSAPCHFLQSPVYYWTSIHYHRQKVRATPLLICCCDAPSLRGIFCQVTPFESQMAVLPCLCINLSYRSRFSLSKYSTLLYFCSYLALYLDFSVVILSSPKKVARLLSGT